MGMACAQPPTPGPTDDVPLRGAWRVIERSYVRGDSSWTEADPAPGLYLFGRSYYGVQEIRESGRRALFDEATTDLERLAAFDVFHAHAGRYETTDTTLTIVPEVAKSPNSMDGRATTYVYALEGDRLTITRRAPVERELRTTVLVRLE